ncbi:diaminopimelate epimerase [Actinomadura alba]|uniref:Diaminopimelate epimerase n=1 Tax=Actinomadura alba TaxID=406431 RepID=A0ABR7M1K9_9ACTN|nr:diaminopimelate epimerase [Actinomadura alba]MBC6471007.1 diaminopimelate epimerase [Actinomadura alba]
MSQLSVTKVHGSRNDILVVDGAPDDHFASGEVARAVLRLCDRRLGLGADGVYFLAVDGDGTARAWFFNPDGSASLLCGNGMRGAGRLLLDRYATEETVVHTGPYAFTVRDAGLSKHGVRQVAVELPPVDFTPAEPIVAGVGYPFVGRVFPAFDPSLAVTALAVPNSHLVTVIDTYSEDALVTTGRRVAGTSAVFPIGANVSFVLPLVPSADEVFIQTYERGAGLTPSCGSGVAASRAVLSRLGLVAPHQSVLVRNPGGVARSRLQDRDGRWQPILEGNATVVFRAELDPAVLLGEGPIQYVGETDFAEITAFDALFKENLEALSAAGVHPTV